MLLALLTASAASAAGPAAPASGCPEDMRLVEGIHYEEVQRICRDFRRNRCWAFVPELVMLEPRRTPVRVCMDRYEWPNRAGELPQVMMRFVDAEASCASLGKRLCRESEWEVACEGPRRWPWPYGWKKEEGRCNVERLYRGYDEAKLESGDPAVREREVQRLWQGAPSGSFSGCESPFGVVDLVGNVEEWVLTDRPQWPHRSGLKGGYWSKAWASCRGTNERHGPQFRFYEIGFRCCREPQ